MTDEFHGAKLAILSGDRIVTILRDDIPSIDWPGHWDLPGGGREGSETPEACVLRELHEELGLAYSVDVLHWSMVSEGASGSVWFFVTEQPGFDPSAVRLGNEGQKWRFASIDWFLHEAKSIPRHRERLALYLASRR